MSIVGRNPYLIEGPALVSFSGGRTSGYMLKHILDAHDGTLPEDVHVVFANTGKEMEVTMSEQALFLLRMTRWCENKFSKMSDDSLCQEFTRFLRNELNEDGNGRDGWTTVFFDCLETVTVFRTPYEVSADGLPLRPQEPQAAIYHAAPAMLAALRRMVANVDRWRETGMPADSEESQDIYAQMVDAIQAATACDAGEHEIAHGETFGPWRR